MLGIYVVFMILKSLGCSDAPSDEYDECMSGDMGKFYVFLLIPASLGYLIQSRIAKYFEARDQELSSSARVAETEEKEDEEKQELSSFASSCLTVIVL